MIPISAYDLGLFIKSALREVYSDHISLGTSGQLVRDDDNQFGEHSLVADFMAEAIIIRKLRALARKNRVTIQVIAEEHGDLMISYTGELVSTDELVPDYTVYIDGLDGSSVYAMATPGQLRFRSSPTPYNRRPRYGTMVGIAQGYYPRYHNVVAAGILEPMTHRVLIATKGGGIALSHPTQVGRGRTVRTAKEWRPSGLVYCDQAAICNRARFESPLKAMYGLTTVSAGSAARYYFDVATGVALASCEWTRKRCLEVVSGYLLVTEAGGIVADLSGLDIGNRTIPAWGTTFTEHFVAAGSDEIAEYILVAVPQPTPAF